MTRRVVDGSRLAFVDVVAASHGHTDHLDPITLRALGSSMLVCPPGLRALAMERADIVPTVVDVDETMVVAGFRFTALRADHDAPGGAVGFVVECGKWRVYHAGDTEAYAGLGERLRSFAPHVALLPINGKLGNMDGRGAARVAKDAGTGLAIPCHFDMFEFNSASPEDFAEECARLGQACRVLRAGERLTLGAPTKRVVLPTELPN